MGKINNNNSSNSLFFGRWPLTKNLKVLIDFRERMRVEAFNSAFGGLRKLLPTLPPDKKLSKIEILRLAICYIKYLDNVLQ